MVINVNECACEGMILFSLHNITLLSNMKTRLFENKIHNFFAVRYFLIFKCADFNAEGMVQCNK